MIGSVSFKRNDIIWWRVKRHNFVSDSGMVTNGKTHNNEESCIQGEGV